MIIVNIKGNNLNKVGTANSVSNHYFMNRMNK